MKQDSDRSDGFDAGIVMRRRYKITEVVSRCRFQDIGLILIMVCTAGYAQDVYLRLTDYGGGKINLVIEPFSTENNSPELITIIKNIENIIRNDLEYSLYFDIFSDTAWLSELENQGVVIRGSGNRSQLNIILEDYETREKIAGKGYTLSKNLRETAHLISDDIIELLTGEIGIASTKIAFSYKTSNGKELAMIDYDGFNFTPLTKNGRFNLFPAWAPDGKRVLFSTHTKDRLNIYLFDLMEKENQ